MGFASSNLVVGIGGLLLQQHNRDDQGFAIKATYGEIDGKAMEIMKDPITDPGKKSHVGMLKLSRMGDTFTTFDQCSIREEAQGMLEMVFQDGKLYNPSNFNEIRQRSTM